MIDRSDEIKQCFFPYDIKRVRKEDKHGKKNKIR